ncbi:hypothetical protein JCM18899A_06460 [Nocardioides sp. AN3]
MSRRQWTLSAGSLTRDVAGIPTAFSAEFGSGGPVIAILGEYDALPGLSQASGVAERTPDPASTTGNGQGCGHHLLGAGSLLAAVPVAQRLWETGAAGRVRYYGCPAEEAAAGKTFMVRDGAFEDVDAAVSWHLAATTTTRQILSLAYAQVHFRFRGVAAHAGASPHLGRRALDAVELMNSACRQVSTPRGSRVGPCARAGPDLRCRDRHGRSRT